jgi:hypothetical protein
MGSRLSALIFLNCASILTMAPAASTRADSALSPASVAALASRLPLQEHRYALSSGVTPQAIYGNTVAWSVAVGPKCTAAPCTREADLYLANLAHFHPVLIRSVGHIGVLDVALSARWLVWLNGPYLRPGWWLWARDLRTGKTTLIDHSSIEGGPAVPSYPSIALNGDELAWTREDCLRGCSAPGPSSVQMEDLASGARRVLGTNTNPCTPLSAVSITPQAITWTRAPLSGFGCPATSTSTVIRLDRRAGTITARTVSVSSGNIPESNGNYVIWESWPINSSTIHLLNWRTGRTRTISRPASADPQINQDLAIWKIDTVTGLEALDLRTSRYVRLEHNTTTGGLNTVMSGPHLGSGRRVIWEETQFPSESAAFKYWLVVADVPQQR